MIHDKKLTRRMVLSTGLALGLVLGASACGAGDEKPYSDGQQSEVSNRETARAPGAIDPGFKTLATVQDKAQVKIDDISAILSANDNGVLLTNSAHTKLIRFYGDKIAWSSADLSFETARFVQDNDRVWIVAVQKADGATNVLVYDAFATGEGQQPVRKQAYGPDANVVMSYNGVAVIDGASVSSYSPRLGLSEPIALPAESTLVTVAPSGYLMFKDNLVSLVGADGAEKWNSGSAHPKSMGDGATASPIAFAASTIAVEWKEGDKSALTFLDVTTGSVIATADTFKKEETYRLRNAQGAPFVFLSNLLVNVSTGKVEVLDAEIADVVDSIVYLENGQGLQLDTLNPVWKQDSKAVVPNLIYQRTAFYIKDDTLYTFALKGS